MPLPPKMFLMVVRIMVVTIVTAIGAMGMATVSASYIRDNASARSIPQLAAVHQSSSWLDSSAKTFPLVSTLAGSSYKTRVAPRNSTFARLPLNSIGGLQPQTGLSGMLEPTGVDLTETPEPSEQIEVSATPQIDDDQPEQHFTGTPEVDDDQEIDSHSSEDQDEQMLTTPSPEQNDDSSSNSEDEGSSQNNHSHKHSSHSGQHQDGGHGGGD
jgi:hypothetical protein